MSYSYCITNRSFEYLSSGNVLYNAPGLTAFPVRLASEIAQRCFHELEQSGHDGPYTIYDPCSGGAYLLASVGFLHGNRIKKIIASDCEIIAIDIARKNLSLLNIKGINERIQNLIKLEEEYKKAFSP